MKDREKYSKILMVAMQPSQDERLARLVGAAKRHAKHGVSKAAVLRLGLSLVERAFGGNPALLAAELDKAWEKERGYTTKESE